MLQQLNILAQMHQNYEWKDDRHEPGLFTIYFNTGQLIQQPAQHNNLSAAKNDSLRKFKSETKFKSKHQLHQKYNDLKNTTQSHLAEKQVKLPYNIRQYKKIAIKLPTETQIDTPKAEQPLLNAERMQRPDIKLKINNINQHFSYDIDKAKAKLFSYRKGRISTHSKISKKLQEKKPKIIERGIYQSNQTDQQTEGAKKLINSDVPNTRKNNARTPFLQYLMKFKQCKAKEGEERRVQKGKLKLNNFITFNNPVQSKSSLRLKTQR